MTEEQKQKMIGTAIALAIVYGVWKFAPNASAKAMALGAGGVIVGKNIPYVKNALA